MNISEKILLYLNKVIEDNAFERLCHLVLYRFGYRDINPVGGKHDRGRDAEIRYFKGETQYGVSTFFFYTRARRTETKFKEDIAKVRKYDHNVSQIVVVTTRKITGALRKKWEVTAKQYECEVRVHDREWLVLQLTANQDIAIDAGILELGEVVDIGSRRIEPSSLPHGSGHRSWRLFRAADYEAAIPEFKKLLARDKTNADVWSALAWCHYRQFHYRDALEAARHALELQPDCPAYLGVKGCILAEQGIENNAPASLVDAKAIFEELAKHGTSWLEQYNLANVLSALGQHDEARAAYEKALHIAPDQPMIWKNLGSTHARLGDSAEEMRCYDRALELDPNLTEALISKGIRLVTEDNQVDEGVNLLEQALRIDEGVGTRWPHIWYWLGFSQRKLERTEEALDAIDRGLAIAPDYGALLNLKADILSRAWRNSAQRTEQAHAFFQRLLEIWPDSLSIRQQLAEMSLATGNPEPFNDLVNDALATTHAPATAYLEACDFTADRIGTEWVRYVSLYDRYRASFMPVTGIADALADEGIPISEKGGEQLSVHFAAAFGTVCHFIAKVPARERTAQTLQAAAHVMRTLSTQVLRHLTYHVAYNIPLGDVHVLSEKLASAILQLPLICLVDISRQLGYICGQLNIPREVLDASMEDLSDTSAWQTSLVGEVLTWANEILKFAKDAE